MVGLVLGAVAVWLLVRASAERAADGARKESQIEIARLNERIFSGNAELDQGRLKLEAAETKIAELQRQLETSQGERVRFEERADRVPDLEQAVRTAAADNEQIKRESADLRERLGRAESSASARQARIGELESDLSELSTQRDKLLSDQEQLKTQMAELNTLIEAERKQTEEKLILIKEAKEQLSDSFKALANEILEEKSQRFTELNKSNIAQILDPLRTKIYEFQTKVEEVYVQEGRDRVALAQQVKQLMELNQQLSNDANNLAQALKGSSKTLGNWGEVILERIFESSGLRKGQEYFIRPTYTREDGTRAQPDAVVVLPESRNVIVDAKASLNAYEEYTLAGSEADRTSAAQRHVAALRAHIQDLSTRNYQGLEGLRTPDFVVMFVPIEPAFVVAVANDSKLWEEAWKKNVLLVSPSSLLFVVRIVTNLWTQELQKRNVQEIVRRGADLYDKLVGFVEDLRTLGQRLTQAKDTYDSAYSKLYTGRGNVIRRAEMLKELGVKPSKALPGELVESAIEVSALPETAEADMKSDTEGEAR